MEFLDLKGLKCPLPALFARRALTRAPVGGVIEIVSDDPLAAIDVPHMCNKEGHEVLAIDRRDGAVRLVLRRRNETLRTD
jgi:tRNA 2-thiouridine synthesizing protein A